MWSKLTQALKGGNSTKDDPSSSSQSGEVLNKVFEQHPNLSMFHANENGLVERQPSPPPSPSIHSKRNMFKRISKAALRDDADAQRATSSFGIPSSITKKNSGSQVSLNANSTEEKPRSSFMPRRSSFDMLRPSPPLPPQDTTGSVREIRNSSRRPSIDVLRQENVRPSPTSMNFKETTGESDYNSPGLDKFNSKRSILRDPNTPGTGQSVRFFPRDAFKVITPDQSLSTEFQDRQDLHQGETPFLDRLAATSPGSSGQAYINQPGPSHPKTRPSISEIFSPLDDDARPESIPEGSDMSLSFTDHISATNDTSNVFDVSQQLNIPAFPPPGLGLDMDSPMFESVSFDESAVENNDILANAKDSYPSRMTSTPYKKDLKGKGKERASHDRSQSFSPGQTMYYSAGNSSGNPSEAAYPSSELKPESMDSSRSTVPTPPSIKSRGRAMSDSVFQNMLRTSSKSASSEPVPEVDINDESSPGLVVYSGGSSEPDPFSANANTYYTPQTMIPPTPPRGATRHIRKTSKEENLIISLQTQLALRTELCAQYETDLKARDELVEMLGKKLSDVEKDDAKKKNALRSWKKKVQELERACRQLEDVVEDSRQDSMERSVMDEASGEALRMLHRQIASLEREKGDWGKREEGLREQVETLEVLVRERSEDIQDLKESLWKRDESERQLKDGIREAKEQIEMMGNITTGIFDEDELKRLLMEKDQKTAEDTQRFKTVEFTLKQELEELKMKCEGLTVQNASWEEHLEELRHQLGSRNEEFVTLNAELEAQWGHTEKATDKILALEREKLEAIAERDAVKADFEELEARMSNMEVEWNVGENKRGELEAESMSLVKEKAEAISERDAVKAELQELVARTSKIEAKLDEAENKRGELEAECQDVWNLKDALEHDRDQLEIALQQEREHAENLARDLQERDNRISQVEQEHTFANHNAARLEENIRQRDEEISQHTQRIIERESELERVREEMSSLKREHLRVVGEQNRALQDATGHEDQTKAHMDELVRAKAEVDVELKTSKDRIIVLKVEVERLRRQIHILQQESADKEVKIVQANKQHAQDKEDLLGLNIALDSKQQELELLKRKHAVRGTAGSTPAHSSKIAHRRDSTIFNATPISRPPSVLSDSGTDTVKKERKLSTDATSFASAKITTLGKSTRINANGTSSALSSVKPRAVVEGMGPPSGPIKPRVSATGTPTPSGRLSSLSRSSSTKVATAPSAPTHAPQLHRRMSSAASTESMHAKAKSLRTSVISPTPHAVPEEDEKENSMTSPLGRGRKNMIPSHG